MNRIYPRNEAQRLADLSTKNAPLLGNKIPLSAYIGAAAFLAVMAFFAFVGAAVGF